MTSERLGLRIAGLGWCLPDEVRHNDSWPESFLRRLEHSQKSDIVSIEKAADGGENRLEPSIAEAMAPYANDPFRGAKRRHVLARGERASDLEVQAAQAALEEAGIEPAEVDTVLVSSFMPDMLLPSNGPLLQQRLGLRKATVHATDLACSSFLQHLWFAAGLIGAGLARNVLSVSSVTMSRFLDLHMPVSLIFGDGAAACVFSAAKSGAGMIGYFGRTHGEYREGIVLTHMHEDGSPAPRFEDVPGRIVLTTLDPASGKTGGLEGARWCRESCLEALAHAKLSLADVSLFLPAQSTKWFPDACRRALGLTTEQTIESFDEVANIGPATIPYNLALARQQGKLHDGDVLLMYSPGVGISRLSAVFRWTA